MTQVIQTFLVLTSPNIQKAYDIAKVFQYLQNVLYFIQQTPNGEMEPHSMWHTTEMFKGTCVPTTHFSSVSC